MREPDPTLLTPQKFTIASAERMQLLGAVIARAVQPEKSAVVIALEGELGAGKTTLTGGLIRAFGIAGAVRSPTYTLIEPYEVDGRHLYHLDLYRLADPDEVEPLGIPELLEAGAVLLIEWPSRAAGTLPPFDITIHIEYPTSGMAGRLIVFQAHSLTGHNIMQKVVAAIPEIGSLSPSFN